MKRRLIRLGTAALMAIGVAVPLGAQPAQAVDPGTVIAVVQKIYSLYQQFAKSKGLTLEQAVQQIETAITNAQKAITDQIDLVAVADVKACAESVVIDFADMDQMTTDSLQAFASNATACATKAQSLIPAVTGTPAAVDQAGFALNAVGPLALAARAKAGYSTAALTSVLVAGDNSLVSALLPTCRKVDESGGEKGVPRVYVWDCVAYDGTESEIGINVPSALTRSQDLATRNTSRAIAQAVLPDLSS